MYARVMFNARKDFLRFDKQYNGIKICCGKKYDDVLPVLKFQILSFRNALTKDGDMAGILTNCGITRNDCSVSFLIIGPAELCCKVAEGLHACAKERKWRIVVHQCELVTEVIRLNLNLSIDFIIFVFDWRTSQSLSEIETNISLIDEHYIISGAVCLVNCKGLSNIMGLSSHKSTKIRDKYNIRFLSANVFKPQICVQLGNRILNLVEAILGVSSGIPTVGFVI